MAELNKRFAALLQFANTEQQRRVLQRLALNGGNFTHCAQELGIHRTTVQSHVRSVTQRAAKQGYSPDHDMVKTVPDGFFVRGVSTYYNKEGAPAGQWVKSAVDNERMEALRQEAQKAFVETIPRAAVSPMPPTVMSADQSLLNCYILTDFHLGMMAWHEETGEDWDIKIAEDLMVRWFETAIAQSPNSYVGLLAQLGDLLHWDGLEAITPTSGNVLDADTRFQKMVRVAIRALRRIVTMLLKKHPVVHIIMAEGNHDIASSVWLREWFSAMYEDEPRISVDNSADPWYCYRHGQTSLFFHHGHKRKPEQVDDIFVAKFREIYGETDHAYAHMGHLHNDKVIETNLMMVNQHRTLAAPDSHASRNGWMSGRDAKVITYSDRYGEVSRITVSPEMVYSKR